MVTSKFEPIALSASRGRIGAWSYYTTSFSLGEVARRVRSVAAVHTSSNLSGMVQRALSDRADDIAQYLEEHEDRFFGSLVIGSFGGQPECFDITVDAEADPLPPGLVVQPSGSVGVLQFRGTEVLFPLDGQHRVEGIKRALARGLVSPDEEVPVVVLGVDLTVHPETGPSEGLVRARRLFTHLNRYAKPVQKFDILALDEDHTAAIAFRAFLENEPAWANRLKPTQDKAIPQDDHSHVATVHTAYDFAMTISRESLRSVWKAEKSAWKKFVQVRPRKETVNRFVEETSRIMKLVRSSFPAVDDCLQAASPGQVVEKHRHDQGGHIMYRSAGWNILGGLLVRLLRDDHDLEESFERASHMPVRLDQAPWAGVLFDPASASMRASTTRQTLAREILEAMAGYEVKPRGNVRPSLKGKKGWEYVVQKCEEETQVELKSDELGAL